jgi:hypothetical protein
MMVRSQWVGMRTDLGRLIGGIEAAGGIILARSQFEPAQELDGFTIDDGLYGIVEFSVSNEAILGLARERIAQLDGEHVLVVDFRNGRVQMREMCAADDSSVIVKAPAATCRFPGQRAEEALRLVAAALRQGATTGYRDRTGTPGPAQCRR